ncbi:hypothetical protein [Chryseobacterium luteum]|uniref:Uncharacterized protein n=1 Tax=Chryseobacterium luteum TaxID=421531 RepID=A0A085YY11_9FLAO|nr:hypothetical protein [Chryseobacterium luteum]KFE97074.1 hypothetical protein IX38_21670 [Chryseobacterium luteum]
MKNNRTDFESRLWADSRQYSGVQLMETFFQFNDLAASKERLNSIMNYAVKRNSCIKEDPSVIIHFRQCIQSFVRACYLIALEEKKRTASTQLENTAPLLLGLLSEKEYQNPLLVFKKAFREYSIKKINVIMYSFRRQRNNQSLIDLIKRAFYRQLNQRRIRNSLLSLKIKSVL